MWVVKLGGSLQENALLDDCLGAVGRRRAGSVVVVPGGGRFADQVRDVQARWDIDDRAAHAMAILAMAQSGFLLASLAPAMRLAAGPDEIRRALDEGRSVIWSALNLLDNPAGIEPGWATTSDSLALWLATTLEPSGVVIVKSCAIAPHLSWEALSERGIVDRAFPAYAARVPCPIRIIAAAEFPGWFSQTPGG